MLGIKVQFFTLLATIKPEFWSVWGYHRYYLQDISETMLVYIRLEETGGELH